MLTTEYNLYKSPAIDKELQLWSLQVTTTMTEGAFFAIQENEKLLAWLGIEPTTLDLRSQSGAFDHLERHPLKNIIITLCYDSIDRA